MALRYIEYEASREIPNIVVDGSPNESTLLTLTHWPGIGQPAGTAADLSAEMAFAHAASGQPVEALGVTNNHFDQDGLVAIFALVDPDVAHRHRELLVDVAAAGDFATYRHRQAARASMAIAAYSDPDRSPFAPDLTGAYGEQCEVLYERLLGQLIDLVLRPERFADLWQEEDRALAGTEAALARGSITLDEHADLDLAVVDIADHEPARSGHRFAGAEYAGAHPMAINNATNCFRILQVHGRSYTYTDRYESWVQYRSRRPHQRVDLRPLADALNAVDVEAGWHAQPPSALTPQLRFDGESSLDRSTVLDLLARHLREAPTAWDPYAATTA